jgi:hypothetical protein
LTATRWGPLATARAARNSRCTSNQYVRLQLGLIAEALHRGLGTAPQHVGRDGIAPGAQLATCCASDPAGTFTGRAAQARCSRKPSLPIRALFIVCV